MDHEGDSGEKILLWITCQVCLDPNLDSQTQASQCGEEPPSLSWWPGEHVMTTLCVEYIFYDL